MFRRFLIRFSKAAPMTVFETVAGRLGNIPSPVLDTKLMPPGDPIILHAIATEVKKLPHQFEYSEVNFAHIIKIVSAISVGLQHKVLVDAEIDLLLNQCLKALVPRAMNLSLLQSLTLIEALQTLPEVFRECESATAIRYGCLISSDKLFLKSSANEMLRMYRAVSSHPLNDGKFKGRLWGRLWHLLETVNTVSDIITTFSICSSFYRHLHNQANKANGIPSGTPKETSMLQLLEKLKAVDVTEIQFESLESFCDCISVVVFFEQETDQAAVGPKLIEALLCHGKFKMVEIDPESKKTKLLQVAPNESPTAQEVIALFNLAASHNFRLFSVNKFFNLLRLVMTNWAIGAIPGLTGKDLVRLLDTSVICLTKDEVQRIANQSTDRFLDVFGDLQGINLLRGITFFSRLSSLSSYNVAARAEMFVQFATKADDSVLAPVNEKLALELLSCGAGFSLRMRPEMEKQLESGKFPILKVRGLVIEPNSEIDTCNQMLVHKINVAQLDDLFTISRGISMLERLDGFGSLHEAFINRAKALLRSEDRSITPEAVLRVAEASSADMLLEIVRWFEINRRNIRDRAIILRLAKSMVKHGIKSDILVELCLKTLVKSLGNPAISDEQRRKQVQPAVLPFFHCLPQISAHSGTSHFLEPFIVLVVRPVIDTALEEIKCLELVHVMLAALMIKVPSNVAKEIVDFVKIPKEGSSAASYLCYWALRSRVKIDDLSPEEKDERPDRQAVLDGIPKVSAMSLRYVLLIIQQHFSANPEEATELTHSMLRRLQFVLQAGASSDVEKATATTALIDMLAARKETPFESEHFNQAIACIPLSLVWFVVETALSDPNISSEPQHMLDLIDSLPGKLPLDQLIRIASLFVEDENISRRIAEKISDSAHAALDSTVTLKTSVKSLGKLPPNLATAVGKSIAPLLSFDHCLQALMALGSKGSPPSDELLSLIAARVLETKSEAKDEDMALMKIVTSKLAPAHPPMERLQAQLFGFGQISDVEQLANFMRTTPKSDFVPLLARLHGLANELTSGRTTPAQRIDLFTSIARSNAGDGKFGEILWKTSLDETMDPGNPPPYDEKMLEKVPVKFKTLTGHMVLECLRVLGQSPSSRDPSEKDANYLSPEMVQQALKWITAPGREVSLTDWMNWASFYATSRLDGVDVLSAATVRSFRKELETQSQFDDNKFAKVLNSLRKSGSWTDEARQMVAQTVDKQLEAMDGRSTCHVFRSLTSDKVLREQFGARMLRRIVAVAPGIDGDDLVAAFHGLNHFPDLPTVEEALEALALRVVTSPQLSTYVVLAALETHARFQVWDPEIAEKIAATLKENNRMVDGRSAASALRNLAALGFGDRQLMAILLKKVDTSVWNLPIAAVVATLNACAELNVLYSEEIQRLFSRLHGFRDWLRHNVEQQALVMAAAKEYHHHLPPHIAKAFVKRAARVHRVS